MDEPILLPEPDDGLATELNDRIDEFNARATGIADGRPCRPNSGTTRVLSWQG
jgi:hypothetical protein